MSNFHTSAIIQSMNIGKQQQLKSTYKDGRMKIEQVILEFLYEATELIIQSRINLQTNKDYGSSQTPRHAQFNLDINKMQCLRHEMEIWKENIKAPLIIDIYSNAEQGPILFERWKICHYEEHINAISDDIQQVCKKLAVLLRAMFVFMGQLPTYQNQLPVSQLAYHLYTIPQDLNDLPDPQISNMSFEPNTTVRDYKFHDVITSVGKLQIQAFYCQISEVTQALEQEISSQSAKVQENDISVSAGGKDSIIFAELELLQSSEYAFTSTNYTSSMSDHMPNLPESVTSEYPQAGKELSNTSLAAHSQTKAQTYEDSEDAQLANMNYTIPAPLGVKNIKLMSTSASTTTARFGSSSHTKLYQNTKRHASGQNSRRPLHLRVKAPSRHPNNTFDITKTTTAKNATRRVKRDQPTMLKSSFHLDQSNAIASPIVTPALPSMKKVHKKTIVAEQSSEPTKESELLKTSASPIAVRRNSMETLPFKVNPSQLLATSHIKQHPTRMRKNSEPEAMPTDIERQALGQTLKSTKQQTKPATNEDPKVAVPKFTHASIPSASSDFYEKVHIQGNVTSPDAPDEFSNELDNIEYLSIRSTIAEHQLLKGDDRDTHSYAGSHMKAHLVNQDDLLSDEEEDLLAFVLPAKVESRVNTDNTSSQSSQLAKSSTNDETIQSWSIKQSISPFLEQHKHAARNSNDRDSRAKTGNMYMKKDSDAQSKEQSQNTLFIEKLNEDVKAVQQKMPIREIHRPRHEPDEKDTDMTDQILANEPIRMRQTMPQPQAGYPIVISDTEIRQTYGQSLHLPNGSPPTSQFGHPKLFSSSPALDGGDFHAFYRGPDKLPTFTSSPGGPPVYDSFYADPNDQSHFDPARSYDLFSPSHSDHSSEIQYSSQFEDKSSGELDLEPAVLRSINSTVHVEPRLAPSMSGSVKEPFQIGTKRDNVSFNAFAPGRITPSPRPFQFAIWAFLGSDRTKMEEQVLSTMENSIEIQQLAIETKLAVRRGAHVFIHVELPPNGIKLAPGEQLTKRITWEGEITYAMYYLICDADADIGPVLIKAKIVVGQSVGVLRSYLTILSKYTSSHTEPEEDIAKVSSDLEVLPKHHQEIPYMALELHELIGSGFFGDAYRATYLGNDVVVKTIRASEFGDTNEEIVREFQHEVAVLSMFGHHPNIVPFKGASTDTSYPLSIITSYLPYGSMEDHIQTIKTSDHVKIGMLRDVASGLLNIHEGGFIHRDIGARNCLVDLNLQVKVCDFGLCRRLSSIRTSPTLLQRHTHGSKSSNGFGPLKYMAPETLQPPHTFSYGSDVYMFGVLMYETFAETKPFRHMSAMEAMQRILAGERLSLPPNVSIDSSVGKLMTECFGESPSARPTMSEILQTLEKKLYENDALMEMKNDENGSLQTQNIGPNHPIYYTPQEFKTSTASPIRRVRRIPSVGSS